MPGPAVDLHRTVRVEHRDPPGNIPKTDAPAGLLALPDLFLQGGKLRFRHAFAIVGHCDQQAVSLLPDPQQDAPALLTGLQPEAFSMTGCKVKEGSRTAAGSTSIFFSTVMRPSNRICCK